MRDRGDWENEKALGSLGPEHWARAKLQVPMLRGGTMTHIDYQLGRI